MPSTTSAPASSTSSQPTCTARSGNAKLIVALGGGRVVDVAKALAGTRDGVRAAAIPTTLSAAEMTRIHRKPAGHEATARNVRAAIVINDPDLSASQPVSELAASSANALAHAVEAPVTIYASTVPTLAAREAIRLIDVAWLVEGEDPSYVGREQLAHAALLSGYGIDAARYGLSHVLSQTLGARSAAPATARPTPRSSPSPSPRWSAATPAASTLTARSASWRDASPAAPGADGIRRLGVPEDRLDACADAAAQRPDLAFTPPAADRDELRALYAEAW